MYFCVVYWSQEVTLIMQKLETINYVAKVLNITKYRAYELIRSGVIPVVRLGKQLRIDVDVFEAWIKNGGKGLSNNDQRKIN